jgi:hypothetical protein
MSFNNRLSSARLAIMVDRSKIKIDSPRRCDSSPVTGSNGKTAMGCNLVLRYCSYRVTMRLRLGSVVTPGASAIVRLSGEANDNRGPPVVTLPSDELKLPLSSANEMAAQ